MVHGFWTVLRCEESDIWSLAVDDPSFFNPLEWSILLELELNISLTDWKNNLPKNLEYLDNLIETWQMWHCDTLGRDKSCHKWFLLNWYSISRNFIAHYRSLLHWCLNPCEKDINLNVASYDNVPSHLFISYRSLVL